jgi:beta-lactamase regulating signal transducer with metallopeptidase domain
MSIEILRAVALVLLNGTLILAFSLLVTSFFGRGPASLRHQVLFSALLSLILLVPASAMLPSWNMPVLPSITSPQESLPPAPSGNTETGSSTGAEAESTDNPAAASGATREAGPKEGKVSAWSAMLGTAVDHLPWIALFFWLAGAVMILIIQLVRWAGAGFIASMASTIENEDHLAIAKRIRAELRLRKPVALLRSEMTAVTMAWGIRRPCIILPVDSADWGSERIEAVLRHEFAHIKRNDNLKHLYTVVASALFWFNPLVWIVMRRLNYEREVACDDQVLNGGVYASSYARHLMDLTVRLTGPKSEKIIPAVMAHSSNIKRRLLSILDPKVNRRPLRPAVAALYLILILALALPVAAFKPWAAAPERNGRWIISGRIHSEGLENVFYLDVKNCSYDPHHPRDFKLLTPDAYLTINKNDEKPAIRFETHVGKGGEYVTTYFLDGVQQPYDDAAAALYTKLLDSFAALKSAKSSRFDEDYNEWYRKWQAGELDYSQAYNEWLKRIDKDLVYNEEYLRWREAREVDPLLKTGEYEEWLKTADKEQILRAAFVKWMEAKSYEKERYLRDDDRSAEQEDRLLDEEARITPGELVDSLLGVNKDIRIDTKHVEIDDQADWFYRFTRQDGYLILTRVLHGKVQLYEVRGTSSGGMTKRYTIDGKEVPWDDAVEQRFRNLLRSMFDFSGMRDRPQPNEPEGSANRNVEGTK